MSSKEKSDSGKQLPEFCFFRPAVVTEEDLEKVKAFDYYSCPRRYCWWWRSLGFEWDISLEEGCTFMRSEKPKGWENVNEPCMRSGADSDIDQYEPRDPHISEDGVDATQWDKCQQ